MKEGFILLIDYPIGLAHQNLKHSPIMQFLID